MSHFRDIYRFLNHLYYQKISKTIAKTIPTRFGAVTKKCKSVCAQMLKGYNTEYKISSPKNPSAVLPDNFVTLSKTSWALISLFVK